VAEAGVEKSSSFIARGIRKGKSWRRDLAVRLSR
jgi:hypothetical protein